MVDVSELFRLVEAYMHDSGATQNAVARLSGIDERTFSSWKSRRTLPDPIDLANLARVTRQPYRLVLDAALTDAGWLPEPDLENLPPEMVLRKRGRRSPKRP